MSLAWVWEMLKISHILRFSRIIRSCRNGIAFKRCGKYKKSIETCRRPPFRVCGATTPCAAPALPERGVLARVVPQSVAQGSAFGLQGGGALKWSRSIKSWHGENLDIQVVSKVFLRETRRNLGSIGGFSALDCFFAVARLRFRGSKMAKMELNKWIFMKNQ